jgi:hypothetical protein
LLIGLITSNDFGSIIRDSINELGQKVCYQNSDLIKFRDCIEEAGKLSLNILIVELSHKLCSDNEFVDGIRDFRAKYDKNSSVRIIIFAPDREEGDIAIAKIIAKQVYDIVNPKLMEMGLEQNEKEKIVKNAIMDQISRRKGTYNDVLHFEVDFHKLDDVLEVSSIYQKPLGNAVIAVAGCERGQGTTHLSIEISLVLARIGLSVAIVEMNNKDDFRHIEKFTSNVKYGKYNSFSINKVDFYKYDIANLNDIFNGNYQYIVMDFGCDFINNKYIAELRRANAKILVCGAKDWNLQNIENTIRTLGKERNRYTYYITNSTNEIYKRAANALLRYDLSSFRAVYNPDPFEESNETTLMIKTILKEILPTIIKEKSIFERFFGFIRNIYRGRK